MGADHRNRLPRVLSPGKMLGNPQRMGGSQDKGKSPRNRAEIKTIFNNLQKCLNSQDNRITSEEVRMGEFSYTYFVDFENDILK